MLQTLLAFVQNAMVVAQSSAGVLLDFSEGSVSLALMEACASMTLWLQYLFVLALQRSRLSTSFSTDVDSFVADFNLARLPGTPASGIVTFSRNSTGMLSVIAPLTTLVQTADLTQTFQVVVDTSNAYYNAVLGVYQLPANVLSADFPVQNVTSGAAGNVAAGTITTISTATPGVDYVSNATAFVNGVDPETDSALKTRFSLYIQSLPRGTVNALLYAISQVQQGLTGSIAENLNTAGVFSPGFITITVDDGTGSPPSSLLANVAIAVNAYRACGTRFAVIAPTVAVATLSFRLVLSNLAIGLATQQVVVSALLTYINAQPVGASLSYARLFQIIWNADPNVVGIETLLLNGGTTDLAPSTQQTVIKSNVGSIAVSLS